MSKECIGGKCLLNQAVTLGSGIHRLLVGTQLDDQFGTIKGLIDPSGKNLNLNVSSNKNLLKEEPVGNGLVRALDIARDLATKENKLDALVEASNLSGASFAYDGNSAKRLLDNSGLSEYSALTQIPSVLASNFIHPDAGVNGDVIPLPVIPAPEDGDTPAASLPEGDNNKLPPVLQYPHDALYDKGAQDYMKIERFKYSPPNANAITDLSTIFTQGLTRSSQAQKYVGSVYLPIPNDLQSSQGMNWGEGTANMLEAGAFIAAQEQISSTMKGDQNLVGFLGKTLQDIAGVGANFAKAAGEDSGTNQAIAGQVAKLLLSKVGINVDPAQFIARKNGEVLNPNMELLFSGPKLRNFVFKYDFAPNSEDDAMKVNKISRFFKQGMTPSRVGPGAGVFIASPDIFRVSYFNGDARIRSLPIHKMCALTNIGFNYTDGGVYQSYADANSISQPVRTVMMLNFTELTPIFGDDYDLSESRTKATDDLIQQTGPLNGPNKINEYDIGF